MRAFVTPQQWYSDCRFQQFDYILQQAVSADALIENLLEKKETFKPRNSYHGLVPGTAPGNQVTLIFLVS